MTSQLKIKSEEKTKILIIQRKRVGLFIRKVVDNTGRFLLQDN